MQYISKSKLLRSLLFTISAKFVINVLPTCIFGLIIVLTFCSVKHFVGIHCYSYAVVCLYMFIELIYCDIIKYFRPTITLSDCTYYIYITFAKMRCILLFKILRIFMNVRKIVLFCDFVPELISPYYGIVYILICMYVGVSLSQSDIEMRHAHCTICSVNKNHIIYVNFSLGSINRQCDHDARVKWVKNHHTMRKQMYVTINQVFTNDWYAFVFSKPLFTLAYIQCIFICFIFIISFGKFIRFSITINLLIAIYPIVSNSALKAKHVYNNFIWGVVNLLIREMSTRIIKNYYKLLVFLYIKRRLVLYELMVYLSCTFSLIYIIIVGFCGLYTTQYVSSNLSQKVVSKLDQYHSNACMSKIYYNLILNTECAVYPVREVYCHINDSDIPPSSGRVVDTHVSSCDMSDAMMNNTCFNIPDQSTLNIIDPDFHYLTVNCCPIDTPYFSEQLFRDKYGNNTNLSMLHLNIRSVPDHFLGLISFLDNLTIELKIIALSETWIKPYHIDYNMPHYSLEQDYRPKKRGGGVCLYIHKSLQYQLRKDLKIGNDSESVNSLFIEIDKLTIGTK